MCHVIFNTIYCNEAAIFDIGDEEHQETLAVLAAIEGIPQKPV